MKVAITGHTRGIGQALFNELTKKGHLVVGYSRSTGYDISEIDTQTKILEEIKDYDVFINNAYSPNAQLNLLKNCIDMWEGSKRLIVNVGSKSIYADVVPDFMKQYVLDKQNQVDLLNQRKLKANPQILNLILGLVDTEMSHQLDAKKLEPATVAELLSNLIELKDKIYVQDLVLDVPFQDWLYIRLNS